MNQGVGCNQMRQPARRSVRQRVAAWTGLLVALWAIFGLASTAAAQSATSGRVVGSVADPSGAVVPRAEVQLVNIETNASSTQQTNEVGQYVFASVPPGSYKITVRMAGFRTAAVPNLTVQVNRSYNLPVTLEVGGESQVVEVRATAAAELQTTDAQIGNVLSTDSVLRLPTLQRNVTELMGLQPGAVPTTGGGATQLQLRITGAVEDQNTVSLDGVDITQSVVAADTVVPTPADSVEEFRLNLANPNASYERASGGQMTLVGRRGTNTLHGAGYGYFQNSVLNANTWDNNRAGIVKPDIMDKRFGGRFGGPIIKDKTFFFANYEARRFSQVTQATRTVPTDTLKQGIVRFRDTAGNVISYNLATAAVCGASGNQACDPRGLGISPAVKAQWALMPAGNVAGGDGLNTTGYLANIPTPVQEDYGVWRLDHKFSDKLSFNGSYTYWRRIAQGAGDIAIMNGEPRSMVSSPRRGQVIMGSLTWQMRPTLFNVFRFGYVRDSNANQATPPTTAAGIMNVSGTSTNAGPVALLIGSGVTAFLDNPIDLDTQRARYQENWNKDYQWSDELSWIRGSHTIQFGGQFRALPYTHARADKVVGSLSSLVALVDGDQSFLTVSAANRPVTCGGSLTTNCLRSTDATNWDRFYASTLGLVDNVNILAVRDGQLNPLPFGTSLINKTNEYATYFHGQDTWRATNSLTLTYGLSYGWQTAPTEELGRQTVQIDPSTGQPQTAAAFLDAKLKGALAGQIYNPTIGWMPVKKANVPVYNIDRGGVSPRASFAWVPTRKEGFLSRLLGERKTVLRGGFAMVYDRSNVVQNVMIPMLGVGFGQSINIKTPACNASGAPGPNCNASAGTGNVGASSYRAGVDGAIPLPTVAPATTPVIPSRPFGEQLSFQVDPDTKMGRSYNVDLTIQREIPGNFVFEAAYVGRFARRLPCSINFTQSPYMFVDSASGQSFAQAFDAVANTLRAGGTPATQPWFENQLAGYTKLINYSGTATAYVAQALASNFRNGNVSSIFQSLGTYRTALGLPPYNNDEAQLELMRTYVGQTNFNGLLVTLSRRLSQGLQFSANYTFSRTLDDFLLWQNSASIYTNSFHPGVEYGPSNYDRTHVFNAHWVYDVPAGKGHKFSFTSPVLDRVIGGWYSSGIFSVFSGPPLTVTESSQAWGDSVTLGQNSALVPINPVPSTAVNKGIPGSGGVGTTASAANGTGLNLFTDPATAFANFRPIQLSQDTRTGRANPIRGLGFWNLDVSFGKTTAVTERVRIRFSADFFNIFNHQNLANPALSYTNPAGFGVITGTYTPPNRTNAARWIEFGIRLEF